MQMELSSIRKTKINHKSQAASLRLRGRRLGPLGVDVLVRWLNDLSSAIRALPPDLEVRLVMLEPRGHLKKPESEVYVRRRLPSSGVGICERLRQGGNPKTPTPVSSFPHAQFKNSG